MHFRARFYDPRIGRFGQKDPVDLLQHYVYAANNPVLNSDPLGLDYEQRQEAQRMLSSGSLSPEAADHARGFIANDQLADDLWNGGVRSEFQQQRHAEAGVEWAKLHDQWTAVDSIAAGAKGSVNFVWKRAESIPVGGIVARGVAMIGGFNNGGTGGFWSIADYLVLGGQGATVVQFTAGNSTRRADELADAGYHPLVVAAIPFLVGSADIATLGAVSKGETILKGEYGLEEFSGDLLNAGLAGLAIGGALKAPKVAPESAAEPSVTHRPTSFRKATIQGDWDSATPGPTGGKLCPTCGKEVKVAPGQGPRDWDVNHDPPWSQRNLEGMNRKQVLDEYNRGTWLECPHCNRSRGARPINE